MLCAQVEGTCNGRYGYVIAVTRILDMGKVRYILIMMTATALMLGSSTAHCMCREYLADLVCCCISGDQVIHGRVSSPVGHGELVPALCQRVFTVYVSL